MLRRDPALWSRTPIRRSTRSVLRPTRSLSKTSIASARHHDESDNDNGKKPEGMSDLEWMRQQHLRRWRKRMEEDTYGSLFGASEEMLRGRGLEGYMEKQRHMHRKGFEWVQKAFPKWMLEDMGLRGSGKGGEEQVEGEYPKKVNIDANEHGEAKEPDRVSRRSWYKDRRFEKDLANEGVKSPSDSRWPREQPLSSLDNPRALHEDIVQELRKDHRIAEEPVAQEQDSAKSSSENHVAYAERVRQSLPTSANQNQADTDNILAEEDLTGNRGADPKSSESGDNQNWRQTALDRRAVHDPIPESRRKTDVPIIDVTAKDKARNRSDAGPEPDARPPVKSNKDSGATAHQAVIDFNGASSSRMGRKEVEEFESRVEETSGEANQHSGVTNASEESGSKPHSRFSPYPRIKTDDRWVPSSKGAAKAFDEFHDVKLSSLHLNDISPGQTDPNISPSPRKSTSDVLKQLPKDDIDFLTADDVRASMGRTKGKGEDKAAVRQKLEEEFGKETPEMDPLLEAQVINGQYVRRKTSEISQSQERTKPVENETLKNVSEHKAEENDSKPVSVLETGLDFMSRWLHNGGNVFAQHFWQDPVQLVAGQLSNADEQFLKGIGIGVLKGRRAFASIKDELVDDIPATQELVNRLNRDEIKASAGAVRLYRDLPSALKDASDADASRAAAHKRIGKLRQELLDTDRQYKKACEAVDGMKNDSKPSFLQRKRLRYASEVLRKNAKLTRMAIFGLQGRIEVEAGNSSGLVARELLHRLLTLQDTQLALSRLVSRTIQVLGIDLNADEEVSKKSEESTFDLSDPSVVEALASVATKDTSGKQTVDSAAANARLEDEVSKQKAAMRGLSDDGYKYAQKPFVRKSFDGPNPLAHSLFRPFGLQLDSLGKDAQATENDIVNAAKKKKGDRELVNEVKKAYEDTYGKITVDHWQVPPAETTPSATEGLEQIYLTETANRQPSIQMLKEDEVSPTITGEVLATVTDSSDVPKNDGTPRESVTEVKAEPRMDVTNEPSQVEELRPLRTSDTQAGTQESPRSLRTNGIKQNIPVTDVKATTGTLAHSVSPENEYSHDTTTDTYVPISYKTFIYNAETDKLSITTSQVPQPNPPITPIPLHEALATLSHPAKFVDHLPESFHVLQVKPDVLSVRTASPFNATAEKNTTTTVDRSGGEQKADAEEDAGWKGINPVDGTTTLSPTGFVSVGSDLDRDFAERRSKADEYHREVNKSRKNAEAPERKKRGRVGVGGVVKTAIWAGAFCYVVGVAAEVAKAPFG